MATVVAIIMTETKVKAVTDFLREIYMCSNVNSERRGKKMHVENVYTLI
jgi:hypothetical protein